jgi:two-component system, response regulator YesN
VAARSILWADLRSSSGPSDLCGSLPKCYGAQRVTTIADVFDAIQKWLPWAVCFEYDHPDAPRLEALTETRRRYRSLPVVMVTERHSEALAAWALGCCVWDYLVKPLSVRRLCSCLTNLDRAVPPPSAHRPAGAMPPVSSSITAVSGTARRHPNASNLAPALSYVEANYSAKLRMGTAARLCELSPFQFSRNFKKENGVTFRDFVVRVRIQRAAELIRQSKISVTEAAFGVGFNDLSYFARMFRRQLGVCPSHYRSQRDGEQMLLFPPSDRLRR